MRDERGFLRGPLASERPRGRARLRVPFTGHPPLRPARAAPLSDRIFFGRLEATVSEVVDAVDLLPDYELAAISVLEGQERPGEEPAVRRRLRSEGIRPPEHRGALLVDPGEMERVSSAGLLSGADEVDLAI